MQHRNFALLPAPHVPRTTSTENTAAPDPTLATCYDSASLLRGNKSITICHNGFTYRLQSTKLGKLILTK